MKSFDIGMFAGAVGCMLVLQFSTTATAQTEKVIYSFCSQQNCTDGMVPEAGLLDVNGTLYGTTDSGGTYGQGAVFALNPSTGAESVIYSFCSQQDCTDGRRPLASLIDVNGTLYGTTAAGGTYDGGTVFALDPNTGTETVPHSFCSQQSCTDGKLPIANLIDVKGALYGTTQQGGSSTFCGTNVGCGTVFALDLATGAETVLHSFCSQENGEDCTDGQLPYAGLINVKGTLYGTTFRGGAYNGGEIFSIKPKTGTETVVYSFCGVAHCTNGYGPDSNLLDMNGKLYGTTGTGGADPNYCGQEFGCGTVFAFDPSTGVGTVVYSFCSQESCTDGESPVAGLINVKGTLYGTTVYGGVDNCSIGLGCGIAFAVNPSTGSETVIYSFCSQQNCADGEYPEAGLIDVKGALYGTTANGGSESGGTVFALKKR